MFTDPISDMLTRIRNASRVKKAEVLIPFSKIKMSIAQILAREGYVVGVEEVEAGSVKKSIKLNLKYVNREPAITNIDRISTPGRRVYVGKYKIPKVRNGMGIAIISTSQGLVSDREARKRQIGGELICEIY